MRKCLALLLAPITAALLLVGCSSHPVGYYDTLCVDPNTQIRMPYTYCTVGNPLYNPLWIYYVHAGYSYPAYGARITNYTVNNYHKPTNATIHTGSLPSTAGKATKYSTGNTRVTPPRRQAPPPDRVGNRNGPAYKPKAPVYRAPAPVRIGRR